MLRQTNTVSCEWFRSLTIAAAIGCWLSFVNSTRADGPSLVPPPAPPASEEVKLPTPELPTLELQALEPIPEPVVESVEITVPSLGTSGDLPALKVPGTQPIAKPKIEQNESVDDETEYVTIQSRKKNIGRATASDSNPALVPPLVPATDPGPPNNPFPNNPFPVGELNPGLTPIETQYSVPTKSTPAQLQRLVETMVLASVPSRHTNDSEWGKTKKVTSGINIGLKGLFLKTERQTKQVNHGEWKKFQLDRKLNSPSYTVKVKKLRMETDKQVRFSADYSVPVRTQAQFVDFSRGIRLRSLNAGGVAMAELSVDVTLNLEPVDQLTDGERTVIVFPIVNSAKLRLAEFKPDNNSRFKSSTARELDSDMQRMVKKQLDKQGKDLARSLNSKLSVDGYHIATNELLKTKWGKMLASSTDKSVTATR